MVFQVDFHLGRSEKSQGRLWTLFEFDIVLPENKTDSSGARTSGWSFPYVETSFQTTQCSFLSSNEKNFEETNNLGRLHFRPICDDDGNVAFVLINELSSDARLQQFSSSFKWSPVNKFLESIKDFPLSRKRNCFQKILEEIPVCCLRLQESSVTRESFLWFQGNHRVLSSFDVSTRVRSLPIVPQSSEYRRFNPSSR